MTLPMNQHVSAISATGTEDNRPQGNVSIVMVSYNTGQFLYEAVAAALSQPELAELIIVNNGNAPEQMAFLQVQAARHANVILMTGQGNVGFAAGCNLGARAARGEYLMLLNPDCVLPEGTLSALVREAQKLRAPWILSPRILLPNGLEQRGSRRPVLTPWLSLAYVLRLQDVMPNHPYFRKLRLHEQPLPSRLTEVPAVSGACMMLRLADWRHLNGMDEGYFLHVEDMDLCLRLQRRGGAVWFAPHVGVKHYGATSKASAVVVEWHKTRSFIRYFYKQFQGFYPPGFLTLVSIAILARFVVRSFVISFRKVGQTITPQRSQIVGPALDN